MSACHTTVRDEGSSDGAIHVIAVMEIAGSRSVDWDDVGCR